MTARTCPTENVCRAQHLAAMNDNVGTLPAPPSIATNRGPGDLRVDGLLAVVGHVQLDPDATDAALLGRDLYNEHRLDIVGVRDPADGGRRKVAVVGDLQVGGTLAAVGLPKTLIVQPSRFRAATAQGLGVEEVNQLQPLADVGLNTAIGMIVYATMHAEGCVCSWKFAVVAGAAGTWRVVTPETYASSNGDEWQLLVRSSSWTSMQLALRWRRAGTWSIRTPIVVVTLRVESRMASDDARFTLVPLVDAQPPSVDASDYGVL